MIERDTADPRIRQLRIHKTNIVSDQTADVRYTLTGGGAADVIIWQRQGAMLLSRYLKGRKRGPLFVTERAARKDLGLTAADLDERGRARLSYDQAEEVFKRWSGGATLHQLRHSSLSHDADAGTGAPMLQAKSGHRDIRSLAKYARVSTEGLARHQRETDPNRR